MKMTYDIFHFFTRRKAGIGKRDSAVSASNDFSRAQSRSAVTASNDQVCFISLYHIYY